jgi:hypothetical protein
MSLLRRISNIFSRLRVDQDIEDELRSHIAMRTDDNIASGMSPEAAKRDAILRFGNPDIAKERVTAVDVALTSERIIADIRFAGRQLRRDPGFTVVAVLTLAVGIGAITAVFEIASETLFHPTSYPESDRIVMLWAHNRDVPSERALMSSLDLRALEQG